MIYGSLSRPQIANAPRPEDMSVPSVQPRYPNIPTKGRVPPVATWRDHITRLGTGYSIGTIIYITTTVVLVGHSSDLSLVPYFLITLSILVFISGISVPMSDPHAMELNLT